MPDSCRLRGAAQYVLVSKRNSAAISTGCGGGAEFHDARRDPATFDGELGGRDRQAKAPRTGAAGVHVDHAIALVDRRTVRVPGYHHLHADGVGLDVDLGEVVDRVEEHVAEPYQLALAQAGRPGAAIVVASHGGERRDGAELLEDA